MFLNGLWNRKEREFKEVNVVVHTCRVCKKKIPTLGTHFKKSDLELFCMCVDPEWGSKVESVKVYV